MELLDSLNILIGVSVIITNDTCKLLPHTSQSALTNLTWSPFPLPWVHACTLQATGQLHPIAVLNVNYGGGSIPPNLNLSPLDELDDVFTRRFFFFDSVSGCA